jgi:hypothetical protein
MPASRGGYETLTHSRETFNSEQARFIRRRVSPLQCLNSPIVTSSPFPSHPTGRSVFPNPAVRQSSSHSMRRLMRVLDDSAPDVDDSPGIQSCIRKFPPPEASMPDSSVIDVEEAMTALGEFSSPDKTRTLVILAAEKLSAYTLPLIIPSAFMAVQIGQQLGSLEITALLGKGGMREVYREIRVWAAA